MVFCWSAECGTGPCRAGHLGWVGPTVLLCLYSFCSMMRPIEPFMTDFLTGMYKNLTAEQVTRQVYPVWTYSGMVLLVPVLLATDYLRYKPVIVLQGLAYVIGMLLLLFGSGVHTTQLAFFTYGVATAAEVALLPYIYSVVRPSFYQRLTAYVKGAILLGYSLGDLLAQVLVSTTEASLRSLACVTLFSVSVALVTSFFLPMPEASLFRKGTLSAQHQANSDEDTGAIRVKGAAKKVGRAFRRIVMDLKECYSSMAVLVFCVWAATGSCGFFQVLAYVQVLWVHVQPVNFTAYNGGVDAFSTLSGAAATVAVGHVSLEWSVWGELVLGGFTFLLTGALFLMDFTDNIWLSYTCITLFRTIYMPLSTICTFQIAKALNRRCFALVFGMNSFVGTVLQSVLTSIVISNKGPQFTINSQFLIYASYFAAISLLFTVRGVYTVFTMKSGRNQAERETNQPEVSRL